MHRQNKSKRKKGFFRPKKIQMEIQIYTKKQKVGKFS